MDETSRASFCAGKNWLSRSCTSEPAVETWSTTGSSVDDTSRKSEIDTYNVKNSSTASQLSELAIHILLLEIRARNLDKEAYQS